MRRSAIVLVFYFADEFFENVFERHQAHDLPLGIAHQVKNAGIQSVAVCFINAYRDARHEMAMRDILLEHRKPDTPVVIGRDVSGPNESVRVVRLGDLDPADVDMRCLLIVGSSQTVWHGDTVFTPRRYPE